MTRPYSPAAFAVIGTALALLMDHPGSRLTGHAQSAVSQTPVFRSSTNLVEVDVMVHDDRDNFVLGLTAEDVEISEDGQPQRIQQMYLVTTDPVTGLVSHDGVVSTSGDLKSHRVFIFVFDEPDLETGALQRIKKGAEDFIARQFTDGDVGAVVVNGRFHGGQLTTSRAALQAGVRAVRPAFDSRESRLRGFREFPRIPGESEAVRIAGGDRFLIQDLGEQACRDDPRTCLEQGGLQQVENKLQQKARSYVGQSRDATRFTLEAMQMVADGLAALPGRKTVVFLSDGFFVEESRNRLQQLAGAAARAGVTIYSVDGRGLAGGRAQTPDVVARDRPLGSTFDTSADGPEILADGTGGFVVHHTDDIAGALGRIARDTSNYYVIGYQPADPRMDGTFRRIKVTAKNRALVIRARKGYVASALPQR